MIAQMHRFHVRSSHGADTTRWDTRVRDQYTMKLKGFPRKRAKIQYRERSAHVNARLDSSNRFEREISNLSE